MEVEFKGRRGDPRRRLGSSLFQQRIAFELQDVELPSREELEAVFQPAEDGEEDVTFTCCSKTGSIPDWAPDFGELRISRHAYDMYPFDHEDQSVRDALSTIEEFFRHVGEELTPSSRDGS